MSFMDEMPPRFQEANFSRINYQAHMDIDQHISEFIAMGGAITQVPAGYSGDPECHRDVRNEFDPTKPRECKERREKGKKGAQVQAMKSPPPKKDYFDGENRAKRRSKYGENIGKYSTEHYYVIINKQYYGAGKNWSHEEAKAFRDKLRSSLGLRPALY